MRMRADRWFVVLAIAVASAGCGTSDGEGGPTSDVDDALLVDSKLFDAASLGIMSTWGALRR
ncbi:MAG: hypothetical protein FJ096_19340 [Deltaproteobacteria bacterium]|nr:hypothetical protein [Deltaproteobacteria bacterium]